MQCILKDTGGKGEARSFYTRVTSISWFVCRDECKQILPEIDVHICKQRYVGYFYIPRLKADFNPIVPRKFFNNLQRVLGA